MKSYPLSLDNAVLQVRLEALVAQTLAGAAPADWQLLRLVPEGSTAALAVAAALGRMVAAEAARRLALRRAEAPRTAAGKRAAQQSRNGFAQRSPRIAPKKANQWGPQVHLPGPAF